MSNFKYSRGEWIADQGTIIHDVSTSLFNEATSAEIWQAVPQGRALLDDVKDLREFREFIAPRNQWGSVYANHGAMVEAKIPENVAYMLMAKGDDWLQSKEYDKWLDEHPEWRTSNKRRLK